jgi:hypothetical protein
MPPLLRLALGQQLPLVELLPRLAMKLTELATMPL